MQNHTPDSVTAEFNAPVDAPAPKLFRVTSTMHLDWPQYGFELQANESGIKNDFESPQAIPAEVREKLTGFIRSGHVRFYDLRPTLHGEMPKEVTPTVDELNDDGTAPPDQDPVALPPGTPNADLPNPNAPIPQNVATSEKPTGDGAPPRDRDDNASRI